MISAASAWSRERWAGQCGFQEGGRPRCPRKLLLRDPCHVPGTSVVSERINILPSGFLG